METQIRLGVAAVIAVANGAPPPEVRREVSPARFREDLPHESSSTLGAVRTDSEERPAAAAPRKGGESGADNW